MRTFLKTGAAITAFAMVAAPAAAITIDDFSTTQVTEDVPLAPPPPSESEAADAAVLGGFRDIDAINAHGVPGGTKASSNQSGGGHFSVSNSAATAGAGWLTYDGGDGDGTAAGVDTDGLGGIDLTFDGSSFFFDVIGNDFAFDYTLTVWDTFGGTDSVMGNIAALTVNGIEEILFSDFGGVDFTSVGAIQLSFAGPNASDLSIDNFRTEGEPFQNVPAPGAIGLLLLGVAGIAAARRRKA